MADYQIDIKFVEDSTADLPTTLGKTKMVGFEDDGIFRLGYQHDGEASMMYWTPDGYPRGNMVIGFGTPDTDYTITFDGEDCNGVITHNEDSATFDFNQSASFGKSEDPITFLSIVSGTSTSTFAMQEDGSLGLDVPTTLTLTSTGKNPFYFKTDDIIIGDSTFAETTITFVCDGGQPSIGTDSSGGLTITCPEKLHLLTTNSIYIYNVKSGATQAAALASEYELWRTESHATLPDGVLMIGLSI
jgi:hypothetical protein